MPPYEFDSPLAAAASSAAAFLQGQQQAKDRATADARQREIDRQTAIQAALQAKYQQSQIDRNDAAAAADARKNQPVDTGAIAPPKPGEDPSNVAYQYFAAAYIAAKAGDEGEAQRLTAIGTSMMNVPKTAAQTAGIKAGTGFTQAKTVTEKARPALIKAQTKNVNDLPEARKAKLQEELTRAQISAQTALERGEMATAAASARQAAAIAAAFSRMNQNHDFQRQQQSRSFTHSDAHPRSSNATKTVSELQPKIAGLPAGVQTVILKMTKEGVSSSGIANAIDASPSLPPEVKAQAKAALGVAPAAAPPAAHATSGGGFNLGGFLDSLRRGIGAGGNAQQ